MMPPIRRQTLFESDAIRINAFAAHPVSDACGELEWLLRFWSEPPTRARG